MRRILIRVVLSPLEEPVDDAKVVVEMRIQRRAETMEEAHGPERGIRWSRGTGLPQGGPKGPEQDVEDGAGGPGPVVEKRPKPFGHGEDELAHRHMGNGSEPCTKA